MFCDRMDVEKRQRVPPFSFSALWDIFYFFLSKGSPLQFLWYFTTDWVFKNPKGSPLSVFWHCEIFFSKWNEQHSAVIRGVPLEVSDSDLYGKFSRCQDQTLCQKRWKNTANCQADVSLKSPVWQGNNRRDVHWPFVLSTSRIHTARNTNNPLLPMSEVRTRQFQLPFESLKQTLFWRALYRQQQR